MSRRGVCDGELPVTQNGRPAGSRSACQPRPGPISAAPRSRSRRTSAGTSSVPRSKWARTAPSGSSRRWNRSWSGRSRVVVPLAGELAGRRVGPAPGQECAPERHLAVVGRHRGVDADLDQPGALTLGPVHRLGRVGFVGGEHAERQASGGGQGAPSVVLGDETGAQLCGPGRRCCRGRGSRGRRARGAARRSAAGGRTTSRAVARSCAARRVRATAGPSASPAPGTRTPPVPRDGLAGTSITACSGVPSVNGRAGSTSRP